MTEAMFGMFCATGGSSNQMLHGWEQLQVDALVVAGLHQWRATVWKMEVEVMYQWPVCFL